MDEAFQDVRESPLLLNGAPHDHDERRYRPEVTAHPKDGSADLLVRKRRERDTPGMWLYTEYQELVVKMLSDIARTNITTLVPMIAPICQTGELGLDRDARG